VPLDSRGKEAKWPRPRVRSGGFRSASAWRLVGTAPRVVLPMLGVREGARLEMRWAAPWRRLDSPPRARSPGPRGQAWKAGLAGPSLPPPARCPGPLAAGHMRAQGESRCCLPTPLGRCAVAGSICSSGSSGGPLFRRRLFVIHGRAPAHVTVGAQLPLPALRFGRGNRGSLSVGPRSMDPQSFLVFLPVGAMVFLVGIRRRGSSALPRTP
jgi:hypothetical protein